MIKKETIIISLGGSVIIPNDIDTDFLKLFVSMIGGYVSKHFKFLIITGGGKTCRRYNKSLKEIVNPKVEDLDWLGIASTRLNAELVRICFKDLAYEKIVLDPDSIPETSRPVLVGGGWKPGNSSDLAAVHGAHSLGATKIINLSNIDYVYDKDPAANTDAKVIKEISWKDFREIIPKEWGPGINSPFDPVAAIEAESLGYEVVILNGKNIENIKNYLDGKEFVGTIIK